MSKAHNIKKAAKKTPAKTMKEKKDAKRAKKDEKKRKGFWRNNKACKTVR